MVAPLQSASHGTTSTGLTVAASFASNLSSGSKMLAWIVVDTTSATTTISTVKDTAGNSFTQAATPVSGSSGGATQGMLYFLDVPAGDVGGTTTITATFTGAAAMMAILIQEVPGLLAGNTTACMDGSPAQVQETPTTSQAQPAYTSHASGEYLTSFIGDNGNSVTYALSGYTLDAHAIQGSANNDCIVGYKNSTNGAESGTWTTSNSPTGSALIVVAFKLAAAGAAAPAPQQSAYLLQQRRPQQAQSRPPAAIVPPPPSTPALPQVQAFLRLGPAQQQFPWVQPDPYTSTYTSLYGGPETPDAPWQQQPQSMGLLLRRGALAVQQSPAIPVTVPPAVVFTAGQPQQSVLFVQRGLPATSQSPNQAVAGPTPTPAQPQATSLLARGIPATVQSPNQAVAGPAPTPAQQQGTSLLLQGIPATLQPPAAPVAGPTPTPAQPQALTFIRLGLPATQQSPPAPVAGPVITYVSGQPQSSPLLLRLGLPTPGNWFQAPPVVIPPPLAQSQSQATSLLRLGLPTPQQFPGAATAPPEPLLDPQFLNGTIVPDNTAGTIALDNYAGTIASDLTSGTITSDNVTGVINSDNYAGTIS